MSARTWTLAEGESEARAPGVTLQIPPRSERENVPANALVRLAFRPFAGGGGERLRVRVLERLAGGRYAGRLETAPYTLTGLQRGDRIEFGPEHVIGIVS